MYDVAIIGAGVVGCAIARELSKYDVDVCVIEKEEDVCCGTSKANSAIVHAGFDATPGSLKAKLNVQGNEMIANLSEELDFPFKAIGSMVVCTKDQDIKDLEALLQRGESNGVKGLTILSRNEILALEPNIADDVTHALFAPTGGIVCPFHFTIALAEHAAQNGVSFFFDTKVNQIEKTDEGFCIHTSQKTFLAKILVNAAGVYTDEIHNMLSQNKFHITPRKGEYLLLDKSCKDYVNHTIFQLPSKMGKGVLVTPTIHGNILVGPTATDIADKDGVNTTSDGLSSIAQKASLGVKDVPLRFVITSFAGLRAHEQMDDFIVGEASDVSGLYDAAGIESPGLTSAPAIGAMLSEMIVQKLSLHKKNEFQATRKGYVHMESLTLEERKEKIKENPAYGNIICRCEMISEGEIVDAIKRPLGARSLDGVKRRTRAGMGRCQSGFCTPRTMEILERELNVSAFSITKSGNDSNILCGYNKQI